ncbi:type I glyceraldehyde-3-phosphate dehydrogenase [Patescibacteria group bacterium]|nr:type I glyceraldehyde-3-phosphate dehydrogenase [Patescibacteria group bacterium]
MRVALNGFGRIGRTVFRANLVHPTIDIVAVNDLGDPKMAAFLLKYDSNYGTLPQDIKGEPGKLTIDGKEVKLVQNRDPELLPWGDLGIDLVIECTGAFTNMEGASKHIKAGAKKVIISAPAKDEIDATIVMGVNEEVYEAANHNIISNASCTTNGLAPVAKVLQETFGITRGLMTTIHSYTNDQNLTDNDHKDMARTRAAALNMIPTSTGAAKAIGLVLPMLKGKMDGLAIRVPTPTVSLVDLTVELEKSTTAEEINDSFRKAASGPLKGILGVEDLPLVSLDFKGDVRSSIVAAPRTKVIDGNFAKIFAWYDNEWGYSVRCLELAKYMGEKGI